jgi:23S rRNA (cytidine1920-2'-O)/16S rRNA (cytidine1409-2'-O)-methyltransferase
VIRRRLDAELVRRHLARSREVARLLVAEGRVKVNGSIAAKPATMVNESDPILVIDADSGEDYVSRGAHKLIGALDTWPGISVTGRKCMDAGASTGGFTEVLLRRGAREVIAVDVGYGQLDWSLRSDPRVHVRDRVNVRHLTGADLPFVPDLTVADLSFISLTLVLPALVRCTAEHGDMAIMVKPQFEVGRQAVGSGGVVRDPQLWASSVLRVATVAYDLGWGTAGVVASSLPGPRGNIEYFLWLRRDAPQPDRADIDAAVEAGP